jgi:hypothetical protein
LFYSKKFKNPSFKLLGRFRPNTPSLPRGRAGPKPAQPIQPPPLLLKPLTGGPHLSGASSSSGRPAQAARAAPPRLFAASNPPQSDPDSSGFLRGFDPLVLLYLSPQESEQMVEYFIRIELVFEFISKTEFLISRSDFLREESDLFNPRL